MSSLRFQPGPLALLFLPWGLTALGACAEAELAPTPQNDAITNEGGDAQGGSSGAAGTSPSSAGSGGAPSGGRGGQATGGGGSAGAAGSGGASGGAGGASGGGGSGGVGGASFGGGGSGGAGGASVGGSPQGPVALLDFKFDEKSGTVVKDSSGQGHDGTLSGGGTWVAGKKGNALQLDGVNAFVALQPGIVSGLTDMTLATWVQVEVAADWQRIFDFGNNTTTQMFLVPQNKETGVMRFVLTVAGKAGQQLLNSPAPFPNGVWTHVAVVLKGATATLYLDGASVASTGGFTLHPSSLGSTTNNWIGRSQSALDPYFKGKLDDFRIYDSALSAAQLATLFSQ